MSVFLALRKICKPGRIFALGTLTLLLSAPAHAAKPRHPHVHASSRVTSSHVAHALPPINRLAPANVPWNADKQGQFVISLAIDTQSGLWSGVEDQGIWHFDPKAEPSRQWTQYTDKDGIGDDDNYAIACDARGRIWAGTLDHGVSVFNGRSWKTYGIADGPLGTHVFGIAAFPTDSDVWTATDAGLARYSLSKDSWSYYTRAEGLPSDQAGANPSFRRPAP